MTALSLSVFGRSAAGALMPSVTEVIDSDSISHDYAFYTLMYLDFGE